jgi:hypothetical protein
MHHNKTHLRRLAARIGQGDDMAVADFLKELEPQLNRIVRRVIQRGVTNSALSRRIAAEARQISGSRQDAVIDSGRLIKEITARICVSTIARLQSGQADERSVCETILGNS